MNLTKECPSCGERLPVKFKDEFMCPQCSVWVKEDPKTILFGSILLPATVYLTYQVDWRLSVLVAIVITCTGFYKLEYTVVDKESKGSDSIAVVDKEPKKESKGSRIKGNQRGQTRLRKSKGSDSIDIDL